MNSWECSKLSFGRYRLLNVLSEASGDRRRLQSRDIYSKEVAWTVELSIIICRAMNTSEFKSCAVLSNIQTLTGIRWVCQILNVCLILRMWTISLTMWLERTQSAVCCLLNRQTRGEQCISTTAAHWRVAYLAVAGLAPILCTSCASLSAHTAVYRSCNNAEV